MVFFWLRGGRPWPLPAPPQFHHYRCPASRPDLTGNFGKHDRSVRGELTTD